MVDRVTEKVRERLGDPVDDCLVESNFLALRNEIDLAAELTREFLDQASRTNESRTERNQPRVVSLSCVPV